MTKEKYYVLKIREWLKTNSTIAIIHFYDIAIIILNDKFRIETIAKIVIAKHCIFRLGFDSTRSWFLTLTSVLSVHSIFFLTTAQREYANGCHLKRYKSATAIQKEPMGIKRVQHLYYMYICMDIVKQKFCDVD